MIKLWLNDDGTYDCVSCTEPTPIIGFNGQSAYYNYRFRETYGGGSGIVAIWAAL